MSTIEWPIDMTSGIVIWLLYQKFYVCETNFSTDAAIFSAVKPK